MAWKIRQKVLSLLDEIVTEFTYEEGGKFESTLPYGNPRVKDIVLCEKLENAKGHVVWYRPSVFLGFNCHSFITESGKRYDAVNDFRVY